MKQGIRRNFARRAASYDCHAEVQRFMARQLLVQAEAPVVQAAHILEVGCGAGYLTAQLRSLNPRTHLVAIDLDAALLEWARRRLGPDPQIAQPRPFSRLLTALVASYQTQFGQNGSIPVTYEVIWPVARK